MAPSVAPAAASAPWPKVAGSYEIRDSPSKGLGMFAARDISRGTLILAEKPLIYIRTAVYNNARIEAMYNDLSDIDKTRFDALYSAHGLASSRPTNLTDNMPPAVREQIQDAWRARTNKKRSTASTFYANAMCSADGASVFDDASRINHSCVPNACFYFHKGRTEEQVRAVRDILKGEEITICYCDPFLDVSARASWLHDQYGFDCDCKACGVRSDQESFAYQSFIRRWRLRELNEEHFYENNSTDRELSDQVEYAVLCVEEGLVVPQLGVAYMSLARIFRIRGSEDLTMKMSKKGVEVFTTIFGADSQAVSQCLDWLDLTKPEEDVPNNTMSVSDSSRTTH